MQKTLRTRNSEDRRDFDDHGLPVLTLPNVLTLPMYGAFSVSHAPYAQAGARWPRVIAAAFFYAAFIGLCAGSVIRASAPLDLIAVASPAAAANPSGVSAALPAQLADNSSCAQLGWRSRPPLLLGGEQGRVVLSSWGWGRERQAS